MLTTTKEQRLQLALQNKANAEQQRELFTANKPSETETKEYCIDLSLKDLLNIFESDISEVIASGKSTFFCNNSFSFNKKLAYLALAKHLNQLSEGLNIFSKFNLIAPLDKNGKYFICFNRILNRNNVASVDLSNYFITESITNIDVSIQSMKVTPTVNNTVENLLSKAIASEVVFGNEELQPSWV
jgi:hypothetical protein